MLAAVNRSVDMVLEKGFGVREKIENRFLIEDGKFKLCMVKWLSVNRVEVLGQFLLDWEGNNAREIIGLVYAVDEAKNKAILKVEKVERGSEEYWVLFGGRNIEEYNLFN